VLLVLFIAVAAACQWPMVGFSSARTNYNPFESRVNVVNVGSLRETWTGPVASSDLQPIVANDVVYAASTGFPFLVAAFDAKGVAGCSGAPKTCTPLWTGSIGVSSLAVARGTLFVASDRLAAFDAAGVQGCSGTPKTCTPLWTASVSVGSLVVAGDFVYASSGDGTLFAFDAAGIQGCSGTPKTCTPLWSADGGLPAVANGIVYTSRFGEIRAFDAAGVQGCSGTPKRCTPLWTGQEPGPSGGIFVESTAPTIAQGMVFIGILGGDEMVLDGTLAAFDAAGVQGCSGTPKKCVAIWRAPTDGVVAPPAVAGDRLYVTDRFVDHFTGVSRTTLRAFDVDACTTSRPPCDPLWTAPATKTRSPTVANGVVYVKTSTQFAAFDGAGNVNCSGLPRTCKPLAAWPVAIEGDAPVIVNGVVYIASGGLHAYQLP
jgi:outer membrane protein assembly factor BamB